MLTNCYHVELDLYTIEMHGMRTTVAYECQFNS